MKKLLETGKIVKTHGIRGEVKIDAWSDTPEFLASFKVMFLKDGTELKIERSRVHKQGVIAKIKGIDTIDDALLYLNKIVYIDKTDVLLDDGVYFIDDLVGLDVVDVETGKKYGVIKEVFQTGSNDVYTVNSDDKTYYVPGIADIVKNVDLEKGSMFIKPIEGLFE
jgi:16S rRNA processing protein RimM